MAKRKQRQALAVGIIPRGGHWDNPKTRTGWGKWSTVLDYRCSHCGHINKVIKNWSGPTPRGAFLCSNCGSQIHFNPRNPSGDFPSTSEYGQTFGDLSKLAEPITKKEAQKLAEQTVAAEEKVALAETGERYLTKEEREKREKELSQEYLKMVGKGPPMAAPLHHIEFGIPRPQYYVGKALEKWQSRPKKEQQLAMFGSPKKKSEEGGLGGVILVLAIGAMVGVALYYANKSDQP